MSGRSYLGNSLRSAADMYGSDFNVSAMLWRVSSLPYRLKSSFASAPTNSATTSQ